MRKIMRAIVVMLSLVMIVAGIGCIAISKYATPAEIDKKAVEYVVDAEVAEPNDYVGYPNLLKAEKLVQDVKSAHILNRQELEQAMQKEDTTYSIHTKTTIDNKQRALQREEMLFGEKGLLSLGLSLAGFGTLTGIGGLFIKRPGDITAPDMEQALATATGKTTAELSVKEKQFIQLVKGVQVFMDDHQNTTDNKEAVMIKRLKIAMDAKQDIDTQAAVAVVKKTS